MVGNVPDIGRKFKIRTYASLVFLYFAGHFLLLLNRGIYWDGLYFMKLLEEKRFDILWAQLERVKVFSLYYVIRLLDYAPDPVFAIKFLAFFSWLIAGLAVYLTLRKVARLPENRAFFIAASFTLIPSFLIKGDVSVLHYSICTMFFFLAALIYFLAVKSRGLIRRYGGYLLSLVLFFFSFFTNSYLIFYALFLSGAICMKYKDAESGERKLFRMVFSWIKKNLIFFLLPLIFWAFRAYLGKPYGAAADYNEFVFFNPGFLTAFAQDLWNGIAYGFFWPIIAPISILQRKIFAGLFIVTGIIVYFISKKILVETKIREEGEYIPGPLFYILSGGVTFLLGLFPYLAVGKSPHIFGLGFGMRHALLLPLGSSLLILGVIILLVKERLQWVIQMIVLSLFIVFNIYNYYGFDMDWYRQRAIVASLEETNDKDIREASTLVIQDNVRLYNYQNRTVSDDEYRSLVYDAFGEKNFKFAVAMGEENKIPDLYRDFKDSYTLPFPKNFTPEKKIVSISLNSGATGETMTVIQWLKLKKWELFYDNQSFINQLKDNLKIGVATKQ